MKIKNGYLGTRELKPRTLMMSHDYVPAWSVRSHKPPIYMTSIFDFESAEEGEKFFEMALGLRENDSGYDPSIYARLNQPNMEMFQHRLALWDGAEDCAAFGSGMAAIKTTLRTFVRPNHFIVHSEPLYGGTDGAIKKGLPEEMGTRSIGFTHTDSFEDIMNKIGQVAHPDWVALVFVETPANPTNTLFDISMCARVVDYLNQNKSPRGCKTRLVVDNTFLGPLFLHPLTHGADLVIYSGTKYIGGHSDLIAGACVGNKEDITALKRKRGEDGDMLDSFSAWLAMRSLETLDVRMGEQVKTAQHIASFLAQHKKVSRVHYLGLLDKASQQYEVYKKQCESPGAMISFEVVGCKLEAYCFLNELGIFKLAVSLGSTGSLAQSPRFMTHRGVDDETKDRMGITPSLVRLSIGLEDPDDLTYDLEQALEVV